MCRDILRAVLCSLRGTLVVLTAECVILQLNKHSAFGKKPWRRLYVCCVQCAELFQVRSYGRQKVSFPWRQLTIPSQGKLPQSQDETADRQRHSKPRRSLRSHTTGQQTSHRCGKDSCVAGSSQGLGGDLETLTMIEKACENCLVWKKNAARQNR